MYDLLPIQDVISLQDPLRGRQLRLQRLAARLSLFQLLLPKQQRPLQLLAALRLSHRLQTSIEDR